MSGRPSWKSLHFLPFAPFSGWSEEHLGNPENAGKGLFPQMSSDLLKPLSLRSQPPFTGARAGKCPPECFFECFWAPGSECPKECFLSAFWRLLAPGAQKHSKSTPGGTCRPGPLSTPVPKGPGDSKNTRRSQFTTRSIFNTALRFTIAAHLVRTSFSWELQAFSLSEKGPRRSKSGRRSKNTTA